MIFYFYKGSGKRNKEIQDLSDIIDEHFLNPEAWKSKWHKVGGTQIESSGEDDSELETHHSPSDELCWR